MIDVMSVYLNVFIVTTCHGRYPVNTMNNSLIEYNLINTVDVSWCYRQV